MTAPRYEAVWARNMIDAALTENNIPIKISGGVFYGQCMQNMLEKAIEGGIELAVTIDSDSIFTAADLARLVQVAIQNDEMDAVAAMQSRRGKAGPLFTKGGESRVYFEGRPLQVSTAHFGLTAIKLDKLKDIPKPWFHSIPNEDGSWLHDAVDDDIYFWRQWKDAGRTVYVDNGCSIGHLEEMVAIIDDNGKHQFMYPNDWLKTVKNISGEYEKPKLEAVK